MKARITIITLAISASFIFSGCATIFGGPVSQCQRTKPAAGQPARAVRGAALVADIIIFAPAVIVDFATGAIYQPCK